MTFTYDEVYDVCRRATRRARKAHQCQACGLAIEPGQRYSATTVIFEGHAETVKRCGRCEVTHRHLVERCRLANQTQWPEEHLDCGQAYEDEWGEAPPAALQAAVFATADEASELLA